MYALETVKFISKMAMINHKIQKKFPKLSGKEIKLLRRKTVYGKEISAQRHTQSLT